MTRSDSSAATSAFSRSAKRRAAFFVAQGVIAGAAALALAACGGSGSSNSGQVKPAGKTTAAAQLHVDNITLIGKIDAKSGAPGTFTGRDGWPAFAPQTIHAHKGDVVRLTIKNYDDMATALPAGSPYNAVTGGTETVNGAPVTSVSNKDIAHTVTIPALGVNIPIAKAPDGGVATVVFTFKVNQAGTFVFQCMTPCGGGSNGMGGAMAKLGWMKGNLVVS